MKTITATLAQAQLKTNQKRTVVTVVGIVLSVSMLTAVCGFAISGIETMRRLVGDAHIAQYAPTIYSLAAVLGAIIMMASIVVISNAFRISAAERTRQFGILKSVGATGRQIVKTVLYEALFLSAISIPTGLILGLLIQWLGASIGDFLLAPMNKLVNSGLSVHMQFVFSWPVILLSAVVSLSTILLSAFLPARKAAKIPAIDAIRLTQEIKLRKGNLRTTRFVKALFGFEGTLAAKSIKRSRRSYRAMVTALSISIILYMMCASINSQLTMAMNQAYNNIDANTYTTMHTYKTGTQSENPALDATVLEQATQEMRVYPDTVLYGVGVDTRFTLKTQNSDLTDTLLDTLEPDQADVNIALAAPDREHYEALCALAGVPVGSNILINSLQRVIHDITTEFQPLRFYHQTLTLENGEERLEIPLHAQLIGAQVPQEILYAGNEDIVIVVPDCQARLYNWFGLSANPQGFVAHAESTLQTLFPGVNDEQNGLAYNVTNIAEVTDMTRSLTRLIAVFLYGFVGMLSLIGLTSVISAISANVRLRAREFAVLASVGMTQGGIRRMLALESVMSALKALLWGLPLGAAGTYLTLLALTSNVRFGYVFPWFTVPEAVLGVFVITLITTQYAAAKLRRGSLMDAIRTNEGV